jgi:hypothetical protein
LMQPIGEYFSELEHEGIRNDLTEDELILAVEEEKGVEVQDGSDLLGECLW